MTSKKPTPETCILGLPISKWDTEELLYMPWHMVAHLTDDEKRSILKRAEKEGIPRPT